MTVDGEPTQTEDDGVSTAEERKRKKLNDRNVKQGVQQQPEKRKPMSMV